jgi:L-ascorbate metabolism protein UlaG (beta-lactamase superfamily)
MALAIMATAPAPGLRAVWLGHASVYMGLDGLRLLVDPIFLDYASPIAGLDPKRFHPPPIALVDFPKIDAVVIPHDHYDDVDKATIQYLSAKGMRFFVPLGVGSHLDEWGIPNSQITELGWWKNVEVVGVKIIGTPSRHYSGGNLRDQMNKLWSFWAIIGFEYRIYYSGDTGLSVHFKIIGKRLGPFYLSIIKMGAYGPGANWFDIHMTPEDSVRPHLAVWARRMLRVHWATFNLAFHDWDEPIKRAVKAASETNVDLVTPRVGEVVEVGAPFLSTRWWEPVTPVTSN